MINDRCAKLKELFREYQAYGIISGRELLLRPETALRLISILEKLDVAVWNVQFWTEQKRADESDAVILMEEMAEFLTVPDSILMDSQAVEKSADYARQYIREQTAENITYVSVYVQEEFYDCFLVPVNS